MSEIKDENIKVSEDSDNSEKKKKSKPDLNLSKYVNCIAIVIYHDQVGYRHQELTNQESTDILHRAIDNMLEVPGFQVCGIVHNKDMHSNELNDEEDKVHAHIMIMPNVRCRITHILKEFSHIIKYDYEADDSLINHEIKVVNIQSNQQKINFVYMAHDTVGAINDGKYFYGYEAIQSNVSEQTLIEWRDWYESHERGVTYNKGHRNSTQRIRLIMDEYYKYGQNGESFKDHIKHLTLEDKMNSAFMNDLEKIYNLGLDEYREERRIVTRCAIYIEGPSSVGKTYNGYDVLKYLGERPYVVDDNAGTGETDRLDIGQSIIYDDIWPRRILKMADDYACDMYRRNANNGFFTGKYLIINSNKSFEDFFDYLNNDSNKNSKVTIEAVKSRFFVVKITNIDLMETKFTTALLNEPFRGNYEEKKRMYNAYMDELMKRINDYHRSTI